MGVISTFTRDKGVEAKGLVIREKKGAGVETDYVAHFGGLVGKSNYCSFISVGNIATGGPRMKERPSS